MIYQLNISLRMPISKTIGLYDCWAQTDIWRLDSIPLNAKEWKWTQRIWVNISINGMLEFNSFGIIHKCSSRRTTNFSFCDRDCIRMGGRQMNISDNVSALSRSKSLSEVMWSASTFVEKKTRNACGRRWELILIDESESTQNYSVIQANQIKKAISKYLRGFNSYFA